MELIWPLDQLVWQGDGMNWITMAESKALYSRMHMSMHVPFSCSSIPLTSPSSITGQASPFQLYPAPTTIQALRIDCCPFHNFTASISMSVLNSIAMQCNAYATAVTQLSHLLVYLRCARYLQWDWSTVFPKPSTSHFNFDNLVPDTPPGSPTTFAII